MREEFKASTVITVAHRINTIMDSTHILVMADGQASEFDSPKTLLERGGLFRDLVQAAQRQDNTRAGQGPIGYQEAGSEAF